MKSRKNLYDLALAVIFLVAYLIGGIYTATVALMVASPMQVLLFRLLEKAFDKTQLIAMGLILPLGGMTLYFHNAKFIQWKFTIIYWVFALILLGSHFIGEKCIMERMLDTKINVPAAILKRSNYAWSLFFIWFGCLNLFIVYHYSEATWVYFKTFGATAILIVASFVFAFYLSRYMQEE